jgi:hypothetical protein
MTIDELKYKPTIMQRSIAIFLCFILPAFSFAQTTLQTVKNNLDKYNNKYPQERIYIQYDKPAYTSGETIWFKAYVMNGINVSDLSKNIYIDLIDADGNMLQHTVCPMVQSSARNQYVIPDKYAGRFIHVRAYTQWMLNFDSSLLYNKDIRIVQTKPSPKTAVKATATTVQFFPESGNQIIGIKSKIAFKAVKQNGLPANIKGVVINDKGVVVDTIKCLHDGMGFFYLEQHDGETYTAKWKDEAGVDNTTALPAAKANGAILEVESIKNKCGFLIKRAETATSNFMQMHIVATMQQQVVYMATVKLDETSIVGGAIPTEQLPSGILQLTLFDSNWVAVAERIKMINNDDYHFEPEVGFSILGTGKRARNVLVVNVPDSIEANLSIAVTDANVGLDSTDDIVSRFLLTGDLKGYVYHPYYYFSNNSDTVAQHLDLVMLTNGWRRIKWESVVNGSFPQTKYAADSTYLTFGGKVYGATPSQLRDAGSIMTIINGKDSSKQFIAIPLQSDGSFSQPDLTFFDTLKVYYQFPAKSGLGNSSEVTFGNGAFIPARRITLDRNNLSFALLDTTGDYYNAFMAMQEAKIKDLLKGNVLQNVTVTTKTKSPIQVLDEKYTSGLFSGGDATQFDVMHDIASSASTNILQYLQGKVAGLMITMSGAPGANASLQWRGATPDLYLDEMKVDVSQIQNIPVTDIAYVKAFRPPFMGSFGGGSGGAIAVYTRRGGDEQKTSTGKGLPYKIVAGYTPVKEFYSPNYDTFDQRNELEDLRTTLYWNPMILTTSQNHIIKMPFYNNDATNSFRIILEGVSKDGKVTRIVKTIE